MRRPLFLVTLLATVAAAAWCFAFDAADPDDMRLLRYPDIHGDLVVFVYGGDLWTVSTQGGLLRSKPSPTPAI